MYPTLLLLKVFGIKTRSRILLASFLTIKVQSFYKFFVNKPQVVTAKDRPAQAFVEKAKGKITDVPLGSPVGCYLQREGSTVVSEPSWVKMKKGSNINEHQEVPGVSLPKNSRI